jgi:hypothetical protein
MIPGMLIGKLRSGRDEEAWHFQDALEAKLYQYNATNQESC